MPLTVKDDSDIPIVNASKIAVAMLLLCIATGIVLLLPPSWSRLYKINLFLHPLIGLFAAIWLWRDIRVAMRPLFGKNPVSWRRKIGVFVFVALLFTAGWYSFRFFFWLPAAAFWLAAVLFWPWRRCLARQIDFVPTLTALIGLVSAVSGVVFAAGGGGRRMMAWLILHRLSSLLFLAFWGVAVWRRRSFSRNGYGGFVRNSMAIAWPALALLVVLAVDSQVGQPRAVNRLHLSTLPLEKREAAEADRIGQRGPRYKRFVEKIDSCGKGADCHPAIVEDHRISTHNISLRTRHFQENLRLLEEEIGERNISTCAGCHYPGLLFDENTHVESYFDADNMGCTFCHQFAAVEFPEDPRKTFVNVELHTNHLAMFDRDGKDTIGGLDRLLINLNPTGHGAVFSKPFYREDEFCQLCHRLQIRPQVEKVFQKPRCVDCHMQPRFVIGEKGREKNHFFPGANLSVFFAANVPKGVDITERYAKGDLPLTIKGWGSFWELRDRTHGDKSIWLQMRVMPAEAPRAGSPFRFSVITLNAGIDHPFPAAPLDLIEAWQSVVVKDQKGRTLLTIGELQADKTPDPLAHRLGGIMMGLDGKPVERNRVWQIKSKTILRDIPFHTDTTDDYEILLPDDIEGPLDISAWWNYRKLNQEFVDWAYGEGVTTMPILKIAEIRATIPLSPRSLEASRQ